VKQHKTNMLCERDKMSAVLTTVWTMLTRSFLIRHTHLYTSTQPSAFAWLSR